MGEVLSRLIIKELRSEAVFSRRNAAYTCGTLLQAAAGELTSQMQSLLQVRACA